MHSKGEKIAKTGVYIRDLRGSGTISHPDSEGEREEETSPGVRILDGMSDPRS